MRLALLCALALGCDSTDTLHAPHFTLERMIRQPRANAYETTTAFEDGFVMREPVAGTVPASELGQTSVFLSGWRTARPPSGCRSR